MDWVQKKAGEVERLFMIWVLEGVWFPDASREEEGREGEEETSQKMAAMKQGAVEKKVALTVEMRVLEGRCRRQKVINTRCGRGGKKGMPR